METELVARLFSFSFSEAEKQSILLEEEDVAFSKEECIRSLFGKVHGYRKANFAGLKNTLSSIWPISDPFILRELGFNLFQFVFTNQEDKHKVLNGKRWSFDKQFIVLKEWHEGMEAKKEPFNLIDIWVQVWNLPHHWISHETGLKIRKMFKKVVDVSIPETGSLRGRHVKVLEKLDLNSPLPRGTCLKLGGKSVWVDFRYENLQHFCFYCGLVGHVDRICNTKKEDQKTNSVKDGQYGEWLKAEEIPLPKKANPAYQNFHTINPSHDMHTYEGEPEANPISHLSPVNSQPLIKPHKTDTQPKLSHSQTLSPTATKNNPTIKQLLCVEQNITPPKIKALTSTTPFPSGPLTKTTDSRIEMLHQSQEMVFPFNSDDLVSIPIIAETVRCPLKDISNSRGSV